MNEKLNEREEGIAELLQKTATASLSIIHHSLEYKDPFINLHRTSYNKHKYNG